MTEKELFLITDKDGNFVGLLKYMQDVNDIMEFDDELQVIPIGDVE